MQNATEQTILCVDDEQSVLNALKRCLRYLPLTVITTTSTSRALQLIAGQTIAVVISDYRMPEMSGVEFLFLVREMKPETKRILLTGQADINGVISAVNDGGVHKFFAKPWDNFTLANAIQECISLYSLEQENQFLSEQLLEANNELYLLNSNLSTQLDDTTKKLDKSQYYDMETDLPNNKLLIKGAVKSIERCTYSNQKIIFIAIGILDHELLNEGLGKNQYNNIIRSIAGQIKRKLRSSDIMARVRTDALCISTIKNGSTDEILEFAQRLIQPVYSDQDSALGKTYFNICAGISVYGKHGSSAPQLIESALSAMHKARNNTEKKIVFYDNASYSNANSKLSLNNDLHQAYENGELSLDFQPRVNAKTQLVTAAEVLLRWQHPVRGFVSPSDFIPLLESSGLIVPVGEWVIGQVCRLTQRLSAGGKPPFLLAVNVSPYQIQTSTFHQRIARAVAEVDVAAEKFLELEITESVMVDNVEQVLNSMQKLKSLGIKLAIDDFGTGYSSLSYLTQFPVDYLKIDQSFITDLTTCSSSLAIVTSVISIAKSLHLKVIAEGVETETQAAILRDLGCDEIQGYLYSPPVGEKALCTLIGTYLPVADTLLLPMSA